MEWAGNIDSGVPEEQEHLQYAPIVSNNVYEKLGDAMTKTMEVI